MWIYDEVPQCKLSGDMVLPIPDDLAYLGVRRGINREPGPGNYENSLYNTYIRGAPRNGEIQELGDTQLSDLSSIITTESSGASGSDYSSTDQ